MTKKTIKKKEHAKEDSQKDVGGDCVSKDGNKKKGGCKGGLALSSGKCKCGVGKKEVNGACIKTSKKSHKLNSHKLNNGKKKKNKKKKIVKKKRILR